MGTNDVLPAPHGIDAEREPREPTGASSYRRAGTAPISKNSTFLDVDPGRPARTDAVPATVSATGGHLVALVSLIEAEDVGSAVAEAGTARARTHRHLVELVGVVGRFAVDGRRFGAVETVGEVEQFAVETEGSCAVGAHVGVVAFHVFGVHGHEAQDQQVHAGRHHGQSE